MLNSYKHYLKLGGFCTRTSFPFIPLATYGNSGR